MAIEIDQDEMMGLLIAGGARQQELAEEAVQDAFVQI
jgi:predicted RNA polymerase sigma factor